VVYEGDWMAKPPNALIKRALEETRKMPAKKPKPAKKKATAGKR